ncbi:MAG: site-specific integrase [Isosphaeraceae bacterium]|nr:site-specific integrase [Isosphaeraceae bacterium]
MGRASVQAKEGSPTCWDSAIKSWLKFTETQDQVAEIPGKVNAIARTKKTRSYTMRWFGKWLAENREPFIKRSYTSIAMDYLRMRAASPGRGGKGTMSPETVWTDYSYLMLFGDWLADRALCEKPNRKEIQSVVPAKVPREIRLPDWTDDLKILRSFRDFSRANIGVYGEERALANLMRQPGEVRDMATYDALRDDLACYSVWALLVVVRGLGCRPTEALTLTWDTVFLRDNRVKFLATKDGRRRKIPSRTVPILFQWVKDGLEEMQARWGGKGRPVCQTSLGSYWCNETSSNGALQDRIAKHGLPAYWLKTAQKLHIQHLLHLGFPPHAVANWTGHTLTVQERHYCQQDAYLPSDDGRDYEDFGVLSDYGLRVREHNARLIRDGADMMPQGNMTG